MGARNKSDLAPSAVDRVRSWVGKDARGAGPTVAFEPALLN